MFTQISFISSIIILFINLFFFKYKKDNILKAYKRMFVWVLLFPLLDMISTFFFFINLGPHYEGNPFGRFLLQNLGVYGFIILYFFALVVWFNTITFTVLITPYVKKLDNSVQEKHMLNIVLGILIVGYVLVFFWNILGTLAYL